MNNILNKIGKIVKEFYSELPKNNYYALTGLYLDLIRERNSLAVSNGYENYFEMQLKKIHKIPEKAWGEYKSCSHKMADKYKPNAVSHDKYPSFLNKIENLKIKFPGDVFTLFNAFPEIENIKNKIEYGVGGNSSKFKYDSNLDKYSITIADTNENQKIAMLIHELSHVLDQEQKDHKIPSIYESEMGAHQIEFDIAKSVSNEFYLADIREYLSCLVRTDFEESIYTNPNQDLVKLFAEKQKRYLGDLSKDTTHLFLHDEKLIQKPLSDLSVAVAVVNILEKNNEK